MIPICKPGRGWAGKGRKSLLVCLSLFGLAVWSLVFLPAGAGPPLFSFRIRGGGTGPDMARDIAVDGEGCAYVAGYSHGGRTGYDFLTLKYAADGRLVWEKRYDGPAGGNDYAQALAVDDEGRAFVVGHSTGLLTSLDAAVIAYDRDGRLLWSARYDGPGHRDDWAYGVCCVPGGGVAVSGYSFGRGTEHDYLVLRFDAAGKLLWSVRHNPARNRDDVCRALAVDDKGNLAVTGVDRTSAGGYDMTTLKVDARGRLEWLARNAGGGQVYDEGKAVGIDSEGNVLVTGFGYSTQTQYDWITVRYDSRGKQTWVRKYDGEAHLIDRANVLCVTLEGGAVVAGTSQTEDSAADCLVFRYDRKGNLVWSVRYNGPGNGADVPVEAVLVPGGDVIVGGTSRGRNTGRDYFLARIDNWGRVKWVRRYDGPVSGEDAAAALALGPDGEVYITGYSHGGESGFEFATLKFDPDGRLLWVARYPGER